MSDSSSLAGSEVTADDGLVLSDKASEQAMASDAAMNEAVDSDLTSKTQQVGDHYLTRFQIWDPKDYVWEPYDPSQIKHIAPREDLYNYFYLDVRYMNERCMYHIQ
ncbi:hypothetical protein AZE42_05439 [Rhizopogon vesiculosus]|uniref:Uncharacterized protein n=1 Tax=Rhizopogon vesiculosus TaxID=180088 RepID=A0A1J8QHD6_9AGAM|nr:hypothetical protein AZE42_05439 [Rhizopogon vesiculosus]